MVVCSLLLPAMSTKRASKKTPTPDPPAAPDTPKKALPTPGAGILTQYIYRLYRTTLKQNPLSISREAMEFLEDIACFVIALAAERAGQFAQHNQHVKITSRDMAGAIHASLPGELGPAVTARGNTATTAYRASVAAGK